MNYSKGFAIVAVVGLLGTAMPFAGAQASTYTAQEQAGIKVVADFYAALDERDAAGGESKRPIRPIAEKYLKPDYKQMGQVNGSAPGGRERFIKSFESSLGGGGPPASAPPDMRQPAKVLYIAAVGDMVVRVSTRGATSIWNMFRVQDGRLSEHWDGTGGPAMMGGRPGGAGGPAGGAPPAGGPARQ
jgi:predicted SnoaL-like aldol condensation-catalyzing enzyme